jgi:hypothetical protein
MTYRVGAIAALGVAILTGRIAAQEATGHVEGWVITPEAQPAASVRVTASGPSLQGRRSVEADTRGFFRLSALPVGTYQIRLALIGYRPVVFTDVAVSLGRTTSLGELHLESQALELGEIVVSAKRALLDFASAATVTNIPSEQFRDLPTGRNFRSIITLAPEAINTGLPGDEVNISGATGPENAYFLDGVNITDPVLAGTSADLPYNFVRELEIKQGGYEAEYGRATGGIVNVVTHSGGNRFGGQIFGFYTNDPLTAEPSFVGASAKEPGFSEYDVGGSLGGPILRDRLWFFAAYDPSVHRHGAELSGFVLPDDREKQHLFASKLTWQAGPQTDVVFTVHGDPSVHHISNPDDAPGGVVNPEAITALGHHGGLVLSALVRQRLGGNIQAELSVARFTRHDDFEGASELGRTEPHFTDFVTGLVSGGVGGSSREHSSRTAARGSISAAHGPHAIKIGLEYEDNRNDRNSDLSAQPGSPGGLIFRPDDTTYVWFRAHARSVVHNRVPSIYAQDSWRLASRVTLNVGMRWDGEYLIGPTGHIQQSFTDQWQPRVGLIYGFGAPGSQKLFGSYARVYEQIPLVLPGGLYVPEPFLRLIYDHDPRIDPSGADSSIIFLVGPANPEPQRDLKGQSFDELTMGYERAVGRTLLAGLRGVYRRLNWAVEDAFDPKSEEFGLGNPGRGNLASVPRARRRYTALVLTVEKPAGGRFDFLASYVLSRSWGNYSGLYDFVANGAGPNQSAQFDDPDLFPNSTGLLPNDRTHVLKFSGAYRLDFGLSIGTALAWMSGTPRNEFGCTLVFCGNFLQPRGSAGRNGAVLDANLRLSYEVGPLRSTTLRPRVYLDVFQLGNRRTALVRDDQHYFVVDTAGDQAPNPQYGKPLVFQPPMSARLGLSVDFGAAP